MALRAGLRSAVPAGLGTDFDTNLSFIQTRRPVGKWFVISAAFRVSLAGRTIVARQLSGGFHLLLRPGMIALLFEQFA